MAYHFVMAGFVVATVSQATSMARRGPISRMTAAGCTLEVKGSHGATPDIVAATGGTGASVGTEAPTAPAGRPALAT